MTSGSAIYPAPAARMSGLLGKGLRRALVCCLLLAGGWAEARSAVIYLPREAEPAEEEAAEELRRYWGRLSGEEPVIRAEAHERQGLRNPRLGLPRRAARPTRPEDFYLGETMVGQVTGALPDDLDKEGFTVSGTSRGIVIRGRSPEGTLAGVYRFLHSQAGVRWYMPTDLGEHVPPATSFPAPGFRLSGEPDFRSREWSGAARFAGPDWERRNLARQRYRFHHNLHTIFTEAVYELRPDFFILLHGERVRPVDAKGAHNYQICFGNPDAAKFAARKAAEFFEANPDEISFSLGMNDTYPICQCRRCQRWVDPAKTFRDRPDYSDLLFTFMNRAAEELSKTHPDKFLGCLAYYWAENVPSFPVHPNVLPYLTADRSMWFDPEFREEDRDLMERWARAGPSTIGIYDYYYGSSFVIPRLFTAITVESLQHASRLGMTGFYAEIGTQWGLDGPKPWLTSQLLWDAEQDGEVLMDEFYQDFFGSAAEPMRRFYERCEEIWLNQEGPVFWLKFYHDFAQLELFPPRVCRELREVLDEAERLAGDETVRARVEMVSEGFRLTELHSELYHGVRRVAEAATLADGDRRVGQMLGDLVEGKRALEDHYRTVIEVNPLHRPTVRMEQKARFLPGMKLAQVIAGLSGAEEEASDLPEPLAAVAEAFPESRAESAWMSRSMDGEEILSNGAFEQESLFLLAGEGALDDPGYTPFLWERWTGEGNPAAFVLTDHRPRKGEHALRVDGAVREVLFQRFPASPGELYEFSAWARGQVSAGSRVEIQLYWTDDEGTRISEELLGIDQLLPGLRSDWERLFVLVRAPEQAANGFACLTVHNQADGDVAYYDDVRVRLLREQSGRPEL